MSWTGIVPRRDGLATLYALPLTTAAWSATGAIVGDNSEQAKLYVFAGLVDGTEYGIYSQAGAEPAESDTLVSAVGNVPTAAQVREEIDSNSTRLATLVSRTAASVTISAPVATTGQITAPIVIGDDYLEANSRAFEWTIAAVAGMDAGTASCEFGVWHRAKGSFTVAGTVTDAGSGNWLLSFDVPKTATAECEPGEYEWSVQVTQEGTEVTQVRNDGDCYKVDLVRKGP